MTSSTNAAAQQPPPLLSHAELEEGITLQLDWEKLQKVAQCGQAVIPVAVQNVDTLEVLIVAFVNRLAVEESLRRRVCVLWSTSRKELWVKGASSGDVLDLIEVRVNCEQNSLLYLVRPKRFGACHTKDATGATRPSCYYRRVFPGPATDANDVGSKAATTDAPSLRNDADVLTDIVLTHISSELAA